MLARRSARLPAFTRRDAIRLVGAGILLIAVLAAVLSIDLLPAAPSDTRPGLSDPIALVLLAGVLVALLLAWLRRFRPELWERDRALVLLALILVAAALLFRVTAERQLLPYLVPSSAVALLCAVLLDGGVALVMSGLLAVLATAVTGEPALAAWVFLGGLAGLITIRRGERLIQFVRAALAIAAALATVAVTFSLLETRDPTAFVQLVLVALASAAGSAIVAAGTFAPLGELFGIVTAFRLLELGDPTHPLLRRLVLEAPGTYHHSILVGNLAERAAEAVGADPLFARVAAYYHDVGKLDRPEAFIENQAGERNLHDDLSPEASAALLAAHVPAGVRIAGEHRIPAAIVACIPEHHGTARMGYFLDRARRAAVLASGAVPGSPAAEAVAASVDESRFRHTGPAPRSREAAILMLADGVEAAVRSLAEPDEAAIRAMVRRIVDERLEDGQLDGTDLTLRDLERIREAFIGQLRGIWHRRVAYPQNALVADELRGSPPEPGA